MNRRLTAAQERGLVLLIGLALLGSAVLLYSIPEQSIAVLGNRTIVLHDVKVLVPTFVEPGKINVNTATIEELVRLPGIGEVFAARIIVYREEHGPFTTLDDLVAVSGIGPRTIENIRDDAVAE